MDETTYTLTEEVTGEETVDGRDCCVLEMSFDLVISHTYDGVVYTVTSMKYWADKATGLLGVKMETSITGNEQEFTSTESYSYNPWTCVFPLEIGKKVETEKTTIQYSNGNQTGEPVVITEEYCVDSKEDITVTAGTFSCWKITMYDGTGNVTQTMWYSDQIKSGVKTTDAEGNTVMELISYSVS